jgi:hypothetical protein
VPPALPLSGPRAARPAQRSKEACRKRQQGRRELQTGRGRRPRAQTGFLVASRRGPCGAGDPAPGPDPLAEIST